MNVVSNSPMHRIGNQCAVTAQFGISFNAIDYIIPQSTVLPILLCNNKPSFYVSNLYSWPWSTAKSKDWKRRRKSAALLETCYLTKHVELFVTSQGFKNYHELHNQLTSIRNFS